MNRTNPRKRNGKNSQGSRRGATSRRRRRKRNIVLRTTLLIILIIMTVIAAFVWKRYSPSKEKADLNKYYGIENKEQVAVVVDDKISEFKGKIEDGKVYVQYETLKNNINSRFYWDSNENLLLYALPTDIVSVSVGSKEYSVSKEKNVEDYVILKTEGNTAYVALDFIKNYTNMTFEVYSNPNRVIVDTKDKVKVAKVKKATQVRYQAGVKSAILGEVAKKDEVQVIESEGLWEKVRTKDGFIGYVKKNTLKETQEVTRKTDFVEPEYTSIKKDYTINMAWHNVTNQTANNNVLSTITSTQGLTTISPTWFHVSDTNGNLDSIASDQYLAYCHQAGIEVWPSLRDFDGGINSSAETLELLSYTSKRENLINKVIAEAAQLDIDGINLDFEKINEECADHYIQFIRELSVKCRQNGLVLSIDNYVPKGYNAHYNRKEQGVFADYVVIMGYDEHWGGSPKAGPVSSLSFVKEGIEETLKEVPKEKVISGIPFFTRLWQETPKTQEEIAEEVGTDAEQYENKVSSQALGMIKAKEAIANAGAEITFDQEVGENFATWEADGSTYKIWLEDEVAVEEKLKLMKENKLAGTAFWALGQEDPSIWNLIIKYVN